jgi:hypothetical protein
MAEAQELSSLRRPCPRGVHIAVKFVRCLGPSMDLRESFGPARK